MARLESAEQRWKKAIDFAERSAKVDPQPATLILIADCWTALGDDSRAAAARARVARSTGYAPNGSPQSGALGEP
jgi:hypothetical protein